MNGKRSVRIGNVQAFWGDWAQAPRKTLELGNVDYLTLDYLAELTMSLLHKQRLKNPGGGYARDFIDLLRDILPECKRRDIKIVTNAGGLNPVGCREAIIELAEELSVDGVVVASVDGDDLMPRLDDLLAQGVTLNNMDTGRPISDVRDRLVSSNAYFGAAPIADALRQGADIVVAGRSTDPALVVGPLMYEFGWAEDDYDRLAAGTIAGHLIECGPHATGGNFEGGWWDVEGMASIGYPIVEVEDSGEFVLTKPEGTGGLVNFHTTAEQLLYEMGDPQHYLGPDVTADISGIQLTEVGKDRVKVAGITGSAPTGMLKVSSAFSDGYIATGTLAFSWPYATAKARRMGEVLIERVNTEGLRYDDLRIDFVGSSAILGPVSPESVDPAEVLMRASLRGQCKEDLVKFGKGLASLGIAGPAGACGFGGRPRPSEVFAYWPALIPNEHVVPVVDVQKVGG
jgi:hypothetical protein